MKKFLLFAFALIMAGAGFSVKAGSVDSEGMPIFYLRGNFGTNNWGVQNQYRFNRSGSLYTLTINSRNAIGECEFKIADDSWDIFNLGADVSIDRSQYVDGTLNGPNMRTSGLDDAVISFTYDPQSTNASIKFVIDGLDPDLTVDPEPQPGQYPDVYLRGDFNSTNWTIKPEYKFNRDGNTYTLTISDSNPVGAGSSFKIGDAEWSVIDLGASTKDLQIDYTQTVLLSKGGANLSTANGLTVGTTISFTYEAGSRTTPVWFTIPGTQRPPVAGLSGTLPVLYINVYTDESKQIFNNEVISKDLNHKNYFEFADYWLDVNDCEWLKELGAENVGSEEKPLALQIKARGNWTRIGFSKKPFKLKLDKKQSLLGLSKSKHFAILAHADDTKGYLRNFTGFNLGKRIGLPWTPSQQPVEVVINGDYRGLYFLTESIRVDADRVDIAELDDNVADPTLASGGYIVELDNYDEDDSAQIRMPEKHCVEGHNFDALRITFDTPEVYSDLQRRFITDQFSTINDCVGANDNNLWSYLDLDDAARYYLVEEIVSHTESYHGSTYLFRDRGEEQKWHFSPLWDFGNAFNGYTDTYFYNCDPFGNTWIPSIRENSKFNAKVRETWLWFMQNEFDGLFQDIDEYVGHLTEAAKADHERWGSASIPGGGQPVADNRNLTAKSSEVKEHITSKVNWLKGQFGDFTKSSYSEPERDNTPAAPLPEYMLANSDIVTAIEAVALDGTEEIYTLQGMRVEKPVPGRFYIVCKGTKAYKILAR